VPDFFSKNTPGGRVEVRIRPSLEKVAAKLKDRLEKINDLTIPNKIASVYLDQWVQKNFQSEGGKVGGWEAIDRAGKILQDTGRLRISFTPFASRTDAGIGSDLKYSKPHDLGIRNMPRRQILPESDDVVEDLFKIYDNNVQGLTRKPLW